MIIKAIRGALLNYLLLFVVVYYSLCAGWYISYSNYFFFPIVYELTDIYGNVLEYAPMNTQGKEDFVYVGAGTQLKIFNSMLRSVNDHGEGLEEIVFPSGKLHKKFLTKTERDHLQYVADILDGYRLFWRLMLVLLGVVVYGMWYWRITPFYLSTVMTYLAIGALLFGTWLRHVGFEAAFVQMHKLLFPAGHIWFFHYEDSLMTTLLKAPDSFEYFGAVFALFTFISFVVCYKLTQVIMRWVFSKFGLR